MINSPASDFNQITSNLIYFIDLRSIVIKTNRFQILDKLLRIRYPSDRQSKLAAIQSDLFHKIFPGRDSSMLTQDLYDPDRHRLPLPRRLHIPRFKSFDHLKIDRSSIIVCTADYRPCSHCQSAQQIFIEDRKSTRLISSHVAITYAVICLKKKNTYLV